MKRLGLQFVYFAMEPPEEEDRMTNRTTSFKTYTQHHTAVFQPSCNNDPQLQNFCDHPDPNRALMGDKRSCECWIR
jgi:hypothetical protein